VSKRSYRRLAVVAGAALALGSMAPAMAQRIDVTGAAGADVSVDPVDATGILTILDVPTSDDLIQLGTGTLLVQELYAKGLLHQTLVDVEAIVEEADLGSILPECGLVAVASCNQGNAGDLNIPVSVLNGGDLGVGVLAPITAPVVANVGNVLNGGLLNNGLGLGLGSILDPEVGVVAAVFASL
jgi:hypothetical protein